MSACRGQSFGLINSTAPGFLVSVTSTSSLTSIDSSAWQGPSRRTLRVASLGAAAVYLNLGSSTITVASSDGVLVLGGSVEAFHLDSGDRYVAFIAATATAVTVNCALGYER